MFKLLLKIIVSIAFPAFLMMLFLRQDIYPDIFNNDFYGYIELGRNIFNELNFLVRWQLDNLLKYPPLFSILIHILTFFTKDPLLSIQYLNTFSASFCLVPLFLVTKRLLNNISAFLVTIFMTYFLALNRPCYHPHLDYFFIFLTITVFWLIWVALTRNNQRGACFIFVGIMISLAYLTKYYGIIYCIWAIISIFYFFRHNHYALKTILKKISFLLLGFLPLFIIYHIFLYVNSNHRQVYDVGVVGFIDGIKGRRERQVYMLNPEGTEFNHLSDCQKFTVASFSLRYPELVQRRYIRGLKETFMIMTKQVFPFEFSKKLYFYISIQFILLIISILITATYPEYRFKIIYVFLFASITAFVPLYPVSERYLMPSIPFYFILWLLGGNGLYNLLAHNRKVKNFKYIVKLLIIVSAIVLVYNYSLKFYREIFRYDRRKEYPYKEYWKAASWIKNDSKNKTGRSKIMSKKTTFAYLADARFIALPYENNWEKIIQFALMKNVDYIILDKKTLFPKRQDQWEYLTKTTIQNSYVNLEYEDVDKNNVIMIFKLYP